MEVEIKNSYSTSYLVVKDTNVHIEEDISETFYAKNENGKTNYSKRLGCDITNDAMKKILQVSEDLLYYREKDYDSSELIKQCFNKLPDDVRQNLIKELSDEYLDD